jgi:hypothetical protein
VRVSYCDAWYAGDLTVDDLSIEDGSIDYDIDADIEATLNAVFDDPDGTLVPHKETDPLASYGQEINVSMSVVGVGQGLADPISLGWFRIQDCESNEKWLRKPNGQYRHGGAQHQITALDRMQAIADDPFLAPQQPPAAATIFGEIVRLSADLVPIGLFDPSLSDALVSRAIVYEGDRVAAMRQLAQSVGGALRFNSDGALYLAAPTVAGALPVWTFNVEATGVDGDIISYNSKVSRDGVVNAIVATGEAATDQAPVLGVAYDLDPGSPVRWGGPFGKVVGTFSSPLLTTSGMAGTAARTVLNNSRRGRERDWTFDAVANFLLELDDPVQLNLPDKTILGRIVKMSLPLRPGTMSVTVRALDTSVTEVM